LRGQARTRAAAAERIRDRGDEPDLAGAVVERVALGDSAVLVLPDGMQRPARADPLEELARGHDAIEAPVIAIADVHVLDEAHDDPGAAEALDQIEHRVVVESALDDRVELDRRQARIARGLDAFENSVELREAAAHLFEDLR